MANRAEKIGAGGSGCPLIGFLSLLPGSPQQLCTELHTQRHFPARKSWALLLKPQLSLLPAPAAAAHSQTPEDAAGTQCVRAVPHTVTQQRPHPPPQACPTPTQQKSRGGHRRPGDRKILFASGNIEPTEVPCFGCAWVFLNGLQKRKIKKYISTELGDRTRAGKAGKMLKGCCLSSLR